MKKLKVEKFENVWDAIADSPEEAANLDARSELMDQIEALIKKNRWTQAEAAQRLNVTQPRISHLSRRQIDRFSVDALLNMATLAGLQIEIAVRAK